jgi:hypothetical protein
VSDREHELDDQEEGEGEVFLTDEAFLESLRLPGAQSVTFDEEEGRG